MGQAFYLFRQFRSKLMITITPIALQEIQRMQTSRHQKDSYFRIGVINGGCSGLIYTLNLEEIADENDTIYQHQNLTIVVAQDTLPYLKDLKIDYSEDLMGGGFRFQNPQSKTTCNCGQSFALNS